MDFTLILTLVLLIFLAVLDFHSKRNRRVYYKDRRVNSFKERVEKTVEVSQHRYDLEKTTFQKRKLQTELKEIKTKARKEQQNIEENHKVIERKYTHEPRYTSIYFAAPTSAGEFIHKYGLSAPKQSLSIYELRVIGKEGKLYTYDNPNKIEQIKVARGELITPVCHMENLYNATHTKLTTIQPGEMYLEGDKWKLKSKAIVKFE